MKKKAIDAGFAAGRILSTTINDEDDDVELKLAFNFDGVIADDEAEQVFQGSV